MKGEYSMFLNNQPLIIYSEENDEKTINLHNDENLNDVLTIIKNLAGRISDHSKDYIGYRIFKEINVISSQVLYIWHKYIELIRNFPAPVNFIMQLDFNKNLKQDLFKFLQKSISLHGIFSKILFYSTGKNFRKFRNKKRND